MGLKDRLNWRVLLLSILRRGNIFRLYQENLDIEYGSSTEAIDSEMKMSARAIYLYHLKNNPGYRTFLEAKGIDLSKAELLSWEEIPLMCKSDYRDFNMILSKETYRYSISGGSTNEPFQYPMSRDADLSLWPNHWLQHKLFGLPPCSPMLMLMGHRTETKSLAKKLYHWISNFHTFNSERIDDYACRKMLEVIEAKRIQLIYGYATSIYLLLKYLHDHNIHINIKGIISTSENVVPICYQWARDYCSCELLNQYGAGDGNIFSFECEAHQGLHVLHNSCSVEILDNEVLLTAVRNRAMPFIRYRVGDLSSGDLIKEKCICGRSLYRIPSIEGRTNQMIKDIDGRDVSLIVFMNIFDYDENIQKYQIREVEYNIIVNMIVTTDKALMKEKHTKLLKEFFKRPVEIVFDEEFYVLPNGKTPLFYRL